MNAAVASAAFPALGTTATVLVTDAGAIDRARAVLEAELDALDLACSRFRPDSELARVNAAAGRPVEVSDLFAEALGAALRAAEVTGGDVDPTVGRALRAIGYDRDFALIRDQPGGPVRAVPAAGWREVGFDGRTVTVPAGVELDLGATAKAFCADRAAQAVADEVGGGVLVNLGGDIAVGGAAPPGGWLVHVTDDHRSDSTAPGQTVTIASGGLATSSVTARRWTRSGRRLHHVVDPRSGEPATVVWRTVSVAAGSCLDANIASTAAIVRGERAPGWLAERALPSRLVRPGGEVVHVAGWPEGDAG